jgi:hypothetical protein
MSFASALREKAGGMVSSVIAVRRLKQRLRAELGLHPDDVILLTEQDCPDLACAVPDCGDGRQTEVVILRRNLTRESLVLHGTISQAGERAIRICPAGV